MGKTASISFDPNEFERAEEVCRLEKTIVGRNYLAVVDLEEHRSAYRPYELGYRRLTVVVVDGHLVEAKEAYSRLKAALLVDKGTLRYSSSLRTIGPA